MSELALLLLVMVAVVNPAAVALAASVEAAPTQRQRRRLAVPALALAAALVGAAVLLHERWLDALNVSAASFEAAAGFVLLAAALVTLARGRAVEAGLLATRSPRGYAFALAFPVTAGPAVLVAAIAYAERSGVGVTLAGAALALGLAALASAEVPTVAPSPLSARHALWLRATARLLATLLTVLGVGLIVDGLRAV